MKTMFLMVSLTVMAVVCLGEDGQSYNIPKDHPAIPASATPAAASDVEVNSAPIHWAVPSGWQELAPTTVRIGNFLIIGKTGRKAEVAVTSFPGSVGTELDNVNRWRRELGLAGIAENELTSRPVTIDGLEGKRYDIGGLSARTIVVSLPRNGSTWFFKLRGDPDVVQESKLAFAQFLQSVHFTPGHDAAPVKVLATQPNPGEPAWNIPSNWLEAQPGPMVLKSFTVTGTEGQRAVVAISTFPGNVGGAFANVNRWRGQLGLAPVAENDLSSVTSSVPVEGGQGVVVDFSGKNPRTAQPARLVAVIVAQGDSTWFYKLIGDNAVVDREKSAFLTFVQNVRYPMTHD